MPKTAIYIRVSKDELSSEGKLQNPDNQLIPIIQLCKARGWDSYTIYEDRASGGNSNRPQFQLMLSHVRQGHHDKIVVWALDRFSREGMTNTLSYIQQLKKYGCGLISVQESWLDTTNEGIGQLLIGIFSWVAEQEKKRISDRTKAALQRKKAQGVKLGRPRKRAPLK